MPILDAVVVEFGLACANAVPELSKQRDGREGRQRCLSKLTSCDPIRTPPEEPALPAGDLLREMSEMVHGTGSAGQSSTGATPAIGQFQNYS